MNRRSFLSGASTFGACAMLGPRAGAIAAELARTPGGADELARDEGFWFQVQQAYTVDRSMVNFNNGGVSPSPACVQEAHARHLAQANQAPAYTMWRLQAPRRETVRAELARTFGVSPEEIAITRNASEGLQICQLGHDLVAGDVVLASTQDYPRMLTTFAQREAREGIRLVQVPVPVPLTDPAVLVRAYEAAMDEHRPKLALVSHVVFLNGQVLPVAEIVRAGRKRGIPVIVDGAHSFAHLVFERADLDCDYFATSLHKWLSAPIGTGMLYVRREKIEELWPLMAASESQASDIRKFEEIGTNPVGLQLAIAEALSFFEALGAERKLARLVYLRDRWVEALAGLSNVVFNTDLTPGRSGGIANVRIEGVDSAELQNHLWSEHGIYTISVKHEELEGLRVSPNVYATPDEIDRFAEALVRVARDGLPG